MKMPLLLKGRDGISLIELLVVLVISAILATALYRTFIGQQKSYTVQEQVADMQQNARVAMNNMIREIRQAGFGRVAMVTGVLRPNTPVAGALTIAVAGNCTALKEISAVNKIKVASNVFSSTMFSIGGIESHNMDPGNPPALDPNDNYYVVTLKSGEGILNYHPINTTPVYDIGTVTYQLVGGSIQRNGQIVADNIESLEFKYYTSSTDEVGTLAPANPQSIQRIRITVTARTSMSDPDYKGGDGFRRRQMTSYVMIRNPLTP